MNRLKLTSFCVTILLIAFSSKAQKIVLSYPFKFEKSYLQKKNYEAYFLANNYINKVPFVLHDNKKAEYVMLDNNFKAEAKFTADIKKTIFDEYDEKYLGGAGLPANNVFHFVYKVTSYKYYGIGSKTTYSYKVESVDFNTNSVSQKELMEMSKGEDELISYSNFGAYYSFTTNDKSGELMLYNLKGDGTIQKKNIPFAIPDGKGKSRNKLSEYLKQTKLVKEDEEAGLETGTQSSKLFDYKEKIVFVINDAASPTHIVSIDKATFIVTEKFIDHSSVLNTGDKEKFYVNSFLSGDKIFSLVLDKKNIQVAVYNAANGNLLKKQEINQDNMVSVLAQLPLAEQRKGGKKTENEVTDFSKLVKALTKGTEGLTVAKNAAGQYIVTAGTYDPVAVSSSGGAGRTTFSSSPGANAIAMSPGTFANYTPGTPIYTTGLANYYKSTSFKFILDTANLNIAKGKIPTSVNDQVKNYMDEVNDKRIAIKQFAVGDKQYYGYYDKDSEAYIIENITISRK
jgi:hypothetical protein